MSSNAELGSRINRARRDAGLSVGELAERLCVNRSLASDLVSGKLSPSRGIVDKLIEILTLDLETIQALRTVSHVTYMSSVRDGPITIDSHAVSDR